MERNEAMRTSEHGARFLFFFPIFLPIFLLESALYADNVSPPYYIGEVLPAPKQATYKDEFIPVYDIAAQRPLAAVVAGSEKAEQLAAEDFIVRICALAGLERPNFAPRSADEPLPQDNVISLGPPTTNPISARLASKTGLAFTPAPKGEQGYLIRTIKDGERYICLAAGGGPMGTYFATMSLVQLLKVEGGKVVLRAATVDDWPTFEMRGTCCYAPEQAAWLALAKFSTLDMNYGSVGTNAWRDPDARGTPTGWGKYTGAGGIDVFASGDNPHSGKRCLCANISSYYKELHGKPDYVSVALMLGETNGYDGPKALPAVPGKYHLSVWMRGNVPEVAVAVTAWSDAKATRQSGTTIAAEPSSIKPTAEWRKYEFGFELPDGLQTFAPQFRVVGWKADGFKIGDGFCVDDVVLTREGSAENLAPNGDVEGLGDLYSAKVAALWDWAVPRGLWPVQYVNPLNVSGWEDDGKLKIQVSDPAQIDDLARTFRISLDRGGTWVMLALDDFASRLGGPAPHYIITNEADRKAFKSLGECHGVLVRELYARLKKTHPHSHMLVCPAYYWNPKGAYQAEGEKYLREFGRLVPEDVLIVWTGPVVRSRKITREQVQVFTDLIGRKPYYWDNTIYARHSQPTYTLDPFDSQYPDRFWEMIAPAGGGSASGRGGLHNNGNAASEAYKVGCLVYGDYAWNPEAYEPTKSLDKALRMVVGEGCTEDANAFRENYYSVRDPHIALTHDISKSSVAELAKEVGPLTQKDIDKIAVQVEAMDAALARLKARSPNKPLLDALEALAAPLRASAQVLRKHGDFSAHAVQKIDGGIVLLEWAFVGGTGHQVYSNQCEPRRATWIYGKGTTTHTMTASFLLDKPPQAAALIIEGQDHDKQGVSKVEILLNGRSIYQGPNKCGKRGWHEWRLDLPPGLLENGQNTLTIRNLEDSSSTNFGWFMLSQAKVLWK
jgi:hypothetical protein